VRLWAFRIATALAVPVLPISHAKRAVLRNNRDYALEQLRKTAEETRALQCSAIRSS